MGKHYTRPGVHGAAQLFSIAKCNEDVETTRRLWITMEGRYIEMLEEKGGNKLLSLDRDCEKLSRKFAQDLENKCASSISIENLLGVVAWKFGKGKPRHALMKHLNANVDDYVQDCSKRAFTRLRVENDDNPSDTKVRDSLNYLCELKGVGPATASAILSLYRPDLYAFMDDEVIECLHEGKRNYTLKTYLDINTKCVELADILGEGWSPRRVGRALWTAARVCATGGNISEESRIKPIKTESAKPTEKKVKKDKDPHTQLGTRASPRLKKQKR